MTDIDLSKLTEEPSDQIIADQPEQELLPETEVVEPPPEKLTARTLGGLKVSQVTETKDYLNILIYGTPGVGKTVLAASADEVEEMSPVLFVDVEGGTYSLRQRFPGVDVVRVQTWQDMQKVYDALFDGKHHYKTVVLDSLTEIQKFSMYQIMRELIASEKDRDPDVPGIREWGKNSEQIRLLVRAFRDLPMNVIFTALVATEKNTRTGLEHKKPSLSGKLGAEVAGFVDIVTYYFIKKVDDVNQRLLLTQQTDTEIAKDRSDRLPVVVVAPTMKQIYNYIHDKTTGETN